MQASRPACHLSAMLLLLLLRLFAAADACNSFQGQFCGGSSSRGASQLVCSLQGKGQAVRVEAGARSSAAALEAANAAADADEPRFHKAKNSRICCKHP